jgi:hypothetical protein
MKLTPIALACWTVYGKCSHSPRVDIGWREYVAAGGPVLHIRKVSNG